jgi:hypothetical protein
MHVTLASGEEEMPSFDIVSEVDLQEIRNAVENANRERMKPSKSPASPIFRLSSWWIFCVRSY